MLADRLPTCDSSQSYNTHLWLKVKKMFPFAYSYRLRNRNLLFVRSNPIVYFELQDCQLLDYTSGNHNLLPNGKMRHSLSSSLSLMNVSGRHRLNIGLSFVRSACQNCFVRRSEKGYESVGCCLNGNKCNRRQYPARSLIDIAKRHCAYGNPHTYRHYRSECFRLSATLPVTVWALDNWVVARRNNMNATISLFMLLLF